MDTEFARVICHFSSDLVFCWIKTQCAWLSIDTDLTLYLGIYQLLEGGGDIAIDKKQNVHPNIMKNETFRLKKSKQALGPGSIFRFKSKCQSFIR